MKKTRVKSKHCSRKANPGRMPAKERRRPRRDAAKEHWISYADDTATELKHQIKRVAALSKVLRNVQSECRTWMTVNTHEIVNEVLRRRQ
jgi:hypothetical protein